MQLKTSLSDDLRRAIVGTKTPDTLNEYANQIMAYDNDLYFLRKVTPASAPAPKKIYKDPNAMDLDAAYGSYAPLRSRERQRRIEEGRCFTCGGKGHFQSTCNKSMPNTYA